MQQYIVYADGSCLRNPGPGAAALVITDEEGNIIREFVKAFPDTTNNRMELTAVISALKVLPECDLIMKTDSQYVVNGVTKWLAGWKRRGWINSQKKPVLNRDLWEELDGHIAAHKGKLKWVWVRGHADNEGNNRADELAQLAARQLQDSLKC